MQLWTALALLSLSICTSSKGATDEYNRRNDERLPTVFIALFVRNKAHVLPYVLTMLEDLDYPKDRIHLYVKSDHNQDRSAEVLALWLDRISHRYHSVNISIVDDGKWYSGEEEESSPLAWSDQRFAHIMQLKEDALNEARRIWADFIWFLDADVFLTNSQVLRALVAEDETVVAPMLKSVGLYSNFWAGMSDNFYYERTDQYLPILERKEQGCFTVPMVHSCVLVKLRRERSRTLTFLSNKVTGYHGPEDDIIVFALSAKKLNVDLKVCNDQQFGYIMLPLDERNDPADDLQNLVNLKLDIAADLGPLQEQLPLFQDLMPPPPSKDKLGVDQIYMINLKRRVDRKGKMDYCFDQLGVDYKLVEAVDGRSIDHNYLAEHGIKMLPVFTEPYHNRPLTFGEIGCFLSHYSVWRDVLDNEYNEVIVFEDDIRFEPFFREKLVSLRQELASLDNDLNWDLVFLGRKILSNTNEPWVDGAAQLVHVGYTYWTLAYLLRFSGAKKLMEAEPLHKMVPVDEYLPIMYNRHPNDTWKDFFPRRNLRYAQAKIINSCKVQRLFKGLHCS